MTTGAKLGLVRGDLDIHQLMRMQVSRADSLEAESLVVFRSAPGAASRTLCINIRQRLEGAIVKNPPALPD